jgi:hypothetical protein
MRYQNVEVFNSISSSKLLAVDYVGTLLTLAGCTLLMLPLIWVRCFSSIFVAVELELQGGVIFPWKSSVVLAPLLSGFIVVGIFCFWEWKGARLPIVPSALFLSIHAAQKADTENSVHL